MASEGAADDNFVLIAGVSGSSGGVSDYASGTWRRDRSQDTVAVECFLREDDGSCRLPCRASEGTPCLGPVARSDDHDDPVSPENCAMRPGHPPPVAVRPRCLCELRIVPVALRGFSDLSHRLPQWSLRPSEYLASPVSSGIDPAGTALSISTIPRLVASCDVQLAESASRSAKTGPPSGCATWSAA